MFFACGIWCLADVSSVSPSSEQSALIINSHVYTFGWFLSTSSKSTFSLPITRSNYGKFRFCGPKVWNSIDESLKSRKYYFFQAET